MLFWPVIGKAITTDDQGFYVEPGETYGRLLEANPERRFIEAPEAPVVLHKPSKVQKRTKPQNGTLARIAACESQGNLYAKNPHSTAKGKYQFLDGSWQYYGKKLWGSTAGKSVWSEKDQDELARYVVTVDGYRPWAASKNCWG